MDAALYELKKSSDFSFKGNLKMTNSSARSGPSPSLLELLRVWALEVLVGQNSEASRSVTYSFRGGKWNMSSFLSLLRCENIRLPLRHHFTAAPEELKKLQ